VPAFKRYWRLPNGGHGVEEPTAVARFHTLFRDAVASHHQGDVPSGNCLSGGLDSSAIVCTAASLKGDARLASQTWKSFGYVPADDRLSERRFMESTAAAAGVGLIVVTADQRSFARTLPEFLVAHDEPVGSASVFAQWLVFRRAAEAGVRVMLDGQGADEVLGGYLGYILTVARSALAGGRLTEFVRLRRDYERAIGTFPLSASRILADAVLPAAIRRRLMTRQEQGLAIMTPNIRSLASLETAADLAPRHDLGATLAADLQARILPALLRYEDGNSMAFSIEARVPFLDHHLVEFAFSLPDSLKVRGMERKRILSKAMEGIVPDDVRARTDKIGFAADPAWLRAYVADHLDELADNANDNERAWFEPRHTRRLLAGLSATGDSENPTWRAINLKLWARRL
jgi:asparagine synthase (glutamine-hydrolysing)